MHDSVDRRSGAPEVVARSRFGWTIDLEQRTKRPQKLRGRMKVLLVEDSDADARLVREMLRETQRSNVDLVHAWKLGEALNLLRSESFDVVLLDLGLPDVMGLDALAPVQAAVPDIPIVV